MTTIQDTVRIQKIMAKTTNLAEISLSCFCSLSLSNILFPAVISFIYYITTLSILIFLGVLHSSVNVSVGFFFGHNIALVVVFLTSGKTDLELDFAVFEIAFCGHESKAVLLNC